MSADPHRELLLRVLRRKGFSTFRVEAAHLRFGLGSTEDLGRPLVDLLDAMEPLDIEDAVRRINHPPTVVVATRGNEYRARGDVNDLCASLRGELVADGLALGSATRAEIAQAAYELGIAVAWLSECTCHGLPEGHCPTAPAQGATP